jgi:hypothetical protein
MTDVYVLDDDGKPKLDDKGNPILKTPKTPIVPPKETQEELVIRLVKEGISAELAPVKENLDNAYKARDEALTKNASYEQEKKDAEIQKLKDDGKDKEAHEAEMAQAKAREEALKQSNIKLTRDVELRSALSTTTFRSENASEMAYKEIVGDLVRNDQNEWVHKSGATIKDYTKTFVTDEANAFLLEQKPNTGAGTQQTTTSSAGDNEGKSLFNLPQAEVLKMARENKLPHQQ